MDHHLDIDRLVGAQLVFTALVRIEKTDGARIAQENSLLVQRVNGRGEKAAPLTFAPTMHLRVLLRKYICGDPDDEEAPGIRHTRESGYPSLIVTPVKTGVHLHPLNLDTLNSQTKCNTYWIRCCHGTKL